MIDRLIYFQGSTPCIIQKNIKKMDSLFWIIIFRLYVASFFMMTLSVIMLPSSQRMFELIVAAMVSAPMLYVLYFYSKKHNPIWENTYFMQLKSRLEELLNSRSSLQACSTSLEQTTTVTIEKKKEEFMVLIERTKGKSSELFENYFDTFEQVAEFIEAHSDVRVSDFKV